MIGHAVTSDAPTTLGPERRYGNGASAGDLIECRLESLRRVGGPRAGPISQSISRSGALSADDRAAASPQVPPPGLSHLAERRLCGAPDWQARTHKRA